MLPVLAAVLIGILFGGITFYNYATLTNAVAAGARTLATNRTLKNESPCLAAENVIYSTASELRKSSININFKFWETTSSCPTTNPKTGVTTGGLSTGDTVTVSATYPCYLTVPILRIGTVDVCPAGDVLTSQTTVRIE
jgi:Flp pilus assembly protein TadG